MGKDINLEEFLSNYTSVLDEIDYKAAFFKELAEKAYVDMAHLLPKINTNYKELTKKLVDALAALYESALDPDDLKNIDLIIDDFKGVPQIILEIMTSLQVQDTVEQCIQHVIDSIKLTHETISGVKGGTADTETLEVIKYLKIIPELFVAQLENIYNKMDENLCFLPRKFEALFKVIRPIITMEELLEGKQERDRIEVIIDELLIVKESDDGKPVELRAKIDKVIDGLSSASIAGALPELSNMIDLSAAAPRNLQQPLTEILIVNDRLVKASDAAKGLLTELYDGDPDNIDCNDRLKSVVNLFSTISEIEIARSVIKDFDIEESGDEGSFELF